jgi:hypothetical protein
LTRISVWLGVAIAMPSGQPDTTGWRVAERQVQGLALNRRAVADADEFELALETLGNALRPCWRDAHAVPALAAGAVVGAFAPA